MKIINHRLYHRIQSPYPFQISPNVGSELSAHYLIMHYTVFNTMEKTVAALIDAKNSASAHLVIGRNGEITQLVPFNRVAWHAGKSRWQELEGMNHYAIGIELVNVGYVTRTNDEKFVNWFGDEIDFQRLIALKHKNNQETRYWEIYPEKQLSTALAVSRLLVQVYDLKDILGHDDIAPDRKVDPGPAFPMADFRATLFNGRQN
jgi:N-acetylmuramoyl-L-alanine amidase